MYHLHITIMEKDLLFTPITDPFLSCTLPSLKTQWITNIFVNGEINSIYCFHNYEEGSYIIDYLPSNILDISAVRGYWFETHNPGATLEDLISQLFTHDYQIIIQQYPNTYAQLPLLFARHLLTVSEIQLDMGFDIFLQAIPKSC